MIQIRRINRTAWEGDCTHISGSGGVGYSFQAKQKSGKIVLLIYSDSGEILTRSFRYDSRNSIEDNLRNNLRLISKIRNGELIFS